MSRKIIIALAVLCVGVAGASFAAVESIKVSGDVSATAVSRDLSLGSEISDTLDSEDFVFSQVRLRFDADLTEGVSAVIRLINERAWGEEGNDDTDIDLDLAYVEMKEFLYQPLTLIIGRQNLRYGNALLIGDPDTNQTAATGATGAFGDLSLRKSFDAVRAILDYSPYTLDLLYANLEEGDTNINEDRNLWGAYATYDWASYNGVTEAYFLYLNQDRDNIHGTPLSSPADGQLEENQSKTYVIGGRVQYDPNDSWTFGLEAAYQFGDVRIIDTAADLGTIDNPYQHLSAWALQLVSQYRFLNDYNAMLQLEYTYLSGDNDITDSRQTAWQPLFEDQTSGEIINILFPNSGTQALTLRGSMMPREDITLGGSYTYLLLSEKVNYDVAVPQYTSLDGPAGNNFYDITGNKRYLGSEIDTYMLYDYTEDVQFKMTSAVFIPGGWFSSDNNSVAYSLKAGVSVDF